jgi:thioredoxin 1
VKVNLEEKKMELLKFSASWCGPCQQLSKILENIELPYPLTEIDIDEDTDRAASFGIRGVPTMVLLDDDGNEIKRVVGAHAPEKLKAELELD